MDASQGQWGPDSLKEALDIMSELLRHGYNPPGIVREGVNVDVVRTCCKHLNIPFVEEDLLRADAERRGTVYVPSPRASVETNRRTPTASVGGSSMLRDDLEPGEIAPDYKTNSPRAGPSSRRPPSPSPAVVYSHSRKRKDRDAAAEAEVIIISDSSDDGASLSNNNKRADKGKHVDRGPPNGAGSSSTAEGSSRNRRVVDYRDTETSRGGPPARPPQSKPLEPRFQGMAHPSQPPPPRTDFYPPPPPGQKLTKGQKRARRLNYDKQVEIQRQAGITFEPPPPLPPGYVRPLENSNIESAVYKPSDPNAINRPVPSWLRGQGSDSSLAAFPSNLPPRPVPSFPQRNAEKQKDKASQPPQLPKQTQQTSAPLLRPPVPRAAAPSPGPPPTIPQTLVPKSSNSVRDEAVTAQDRATQSARNDGDASVDSAITATHGSADMSFQSARSQPETESQSLLQRIGSVPKPNIELLELSPDRSSLDDDGDATFVDALLPSDQMLSTLNDNNPTSGQTLAPPALNEDTESDYEPTYEPDFDEEPSTHPSFVSVPDANTAQGGLGQRQDPQIGASVPTPANPPAQSLADRLQAQTAPPPGSGSLPPLPKPTKTRRGGKKKKALNGSSPMINVDQHHGFGSAPPGMSGFPHLAQNFWPTGDVASAGQVFIPGQMPFGGAPLNWDPAQNGHYMPHFQPSREEGFHLTPQASASSTSFAPVKQETGSPPMPFSTLPTPPAASDVQGNLAKMREAALASMLGKRKKPAPAATVVPSPTFAAPANPTPPGTSIPVANLAAVTQAQISMEVDAPGKPDSIMQPLDHSLDEPAVNFSDSGVVITGPSVPAAVASRKQVSYADAFPTRSPSGIRARRKDMTADMGIPSGDLELDITDPASQPVAAPPMSAPPLGSSSSSNNVPPASAGWSQKRGRPTAADFFEGFQYGADRARAPWVRRGPFLKIPDWQQRSYGTITMDEDSCADGSDDDGGSDLEGDDAPPTASAGEPSSAGAAQPSWLLEGPALRKYHLQELDGIVGMLRSGKTPTLAQLRPNQAGPIRTPVQRATSLGALQVPGPRLSPAAGPSSDLVRQPLTKSATAQKVRGGDALSHLSISLPSASSLPPSAVGTPTGGHSHDGGEPKGQQAEMKAKLAAYEANLRMMKEQMARLEEMRAKQKAMDIAQKRRAASRIPTPGSGAQVELSGMKNGAPSTTEQLPAAAAMQDAVITEPAMASAEHPKATEPPIASSQSQTPSKNDDNTKELLLLSPGSEPQDGEEYIPEDDSFMLDTLQIAAVLAPLTHSEPPVTGQDETADDSQSRAEADTSSRWTPYVSPFTTFPALRRLADGPK
ncbi:unnamed protein product [Tilletia laevis]|uniref:Uncharacterized protein n=2 Tax=Tilletia TaxID=13289 RepID=A0A9N8LIE6_9BASI|nr:unnamed protein product [Tilletia caries]CAD6907648.1 unnamed protein product [Tilletia caries]CAD6908098.1 unnamed protein product [Tilletia laevis]CAD6909809.1 unnamed protein product [Tilletia laevis]CAD7060692.1 unnamed protein product [Tilletia caries]